MAKFFARLNANSVHKIHSCLRLAVWHLNLEKLEQKAVTADDRQKPFLTCSNDKCARLAARGRSLYPRLEDSADRLAKSRPRSGPRMKGANPVVNYSSRKTPIDVPIFFGENRREGCTVVILRTRFQSAVNDSLDRPLHEPATEFRKPLRKLLHTLLRIDR